MRSQVIVISAPAEIRRGAEINSTIPMDSAPIEHRTTGNDPRLPIADLRLLVLTELFLPTKGGTAVWFDTVYRLLGGKDVHVITADVAGAVEHDLDHPNTVHRIPMVRQWWLK